MTMRQQSKRQGDGDENEEKIWGRREREVYVGEQEKTRGTQTCWHLLRNECAPTEKRTTLNRKEKGQELKEFLLAFFLLFCSVESV